MPYRNYDASLGRFFQVDPLASQDHTTSPFAYGGNNPVMFNDPSGLTIDYSTSYENPDYAFMMAERRMREASNAQNANSMANSGGVWHSDYWESGIGSGNWGSTGGGSPAAGPGGSVTYTSAEAIANVIKALQGGATPDQIYDAATKGSGYVLVSGQSYTDQEDNNNSYNSGVFAEISSPDRSKNQTQGGALIPDEGTRYTAVHGADFDIVRERQIKHANFGYTETTRVVTISYGEGTEHKIESYGYQTKKYIEYGTLEQWEKSPYINTVLGSNFKIGEKFQEQIQKTVNSHLSYDYYTDWITIPQNRLKAVSNPHRAK